MNWTSYLQLSVLCHWCIYTLDNSGSTFLHRLTNNSLWPDNYTYYIIDITHLKAICMNSLDSVVWYPPSQSFHSEFCSQKKCPLITASTAKHYVHILTTTKQPCSHLEQWLLDMLSNKPEGIMLQILPSFGNSIIHLIMFWIFPIMLRLCSIYSQFNSIYLYFYIYV